MGMSPFDIEFINHKSWYAPDAPIERFQADMSHATIFTAVLSLVVLFLSISFQPRNREEVQKWMSQWNHSFVGAAGVFLVVFCFFYGVTVSILQLDDSTR